MEKIRQRILDEFGNRLRVRVCGICIEQGMILLVNHHSLNNNDDFWGPPGGGMDFGLSAENNLKREFLEETGLMIEVKKFLFVHEYLSAPLHAIELIYAVRRTGGKLYTGTDPEMGEKEQIIKNVAFIKLTKLVEMEKENLHQLFSHTKDLTEIENLTGYFLSKK